MTERKERYRDVVSLGQQVPAPALVDSAILETVKSPFWGAAVAMTGVVELRHDYPEFTSLCPITGAPDFAKVFVKYEPHKLIVESKSFKLFLQSFRSHEDFHEACAAEILTILVELLDPAWMEVKMEFTPRGGIAIWPTAHYYRMDPDTPITALVG